MILPMPKRHNTDIEGHSLILQHPGTYAFASVNQFLLQYYRKASSSKPLV